MREVQPDLMPFIEVDNPFNYQTFERQRAWERYYLYEAAKKGSIVFWLTGEVENKEYSDKVYAHITMMEFGEWIARSKADKKINLIIGTDGTFPEWSTIENEIRTELPKLVICESLEETIDTAIKFCALDKLL